MAKITIIISLTVLCLVLFSSTYGENHWREQLQKRLARAPETDFSFWNNFFWGRTSTKKTRPTTATTTKKVTSATTTKKVTATTTASTTKKGTSVSTTSPSSAFTAFQNEGLAQTNKYRAAYCAPNLILNSTLNSIAQAYANKLVQIGSLVHSNNGYGENLYYAMYGQATDISSIQGSTPVDSWYSEYIQYDWNSPGFSSTTGHFTQLVWINTKQLGMGIACTSDKKTCYMVANYSPPGNYENQYQANVKKGPKC